MNLYCVWEEGVEYVSFAFAVHANQAKKLHCELDEGADYHNLITRFVGKTVKVKEPELVDWHKHHLYPIVKEMGEHYEDDEGVKLE